MPTARAYLGNMGITRQGVDRLLAGQKVTSHALRTRVLALRKLQEQIAHFCPWPALEGSFQADIDAIEAELQRRK